MKIRKVLLLCFATATLFGCSSASKIQKYSHVVKSSKFNDYLADAIDTVSLLSEEDDDIFYSFIAKGTSNSVSEVSLNVGGKAKATTTTKSTSEGITKFDAYNGRLYSSSKAKSVQKGPKIKNTTVSKFEQQYQSAGKNVYTIDLIDQSYSYAKSTDTLYDIGMMAYSSISMFDVLTQIYDSDEPTFYVDNNNTLFTVVVEKDNIIDLDEELEEDDYIVNFSKIVYQFEITPSK